MSDYDRWRDERDQFRDYGDGRERGSFAQAADRGRAVSGREDDARDGWRRDAMRGDDWRRRDAGSGEDRFRRPPGAADPAFERGFGNGYAGQGSDRGGNDYYGGFYGADQGYGRPRQGPTDRDRWPWDHGGRGAIDYGRGRRDQGRDDRDVFGYRGERGMFERAGDEIASWFGDEDAARRRERDARDGDEGAQHHVGRGPRNYTRSDDRIREDVNDRLTDDHRVDASDIEVAVANREVTLGGFVTSRFEKRRAEDIAESVSGVTHVQNNLRIKGIGTASGTASADVDAPVALGDLPSDATRRKLDL